MGIQSLLSERAAIRRANVNPGNAGDAEAAWSDVAADVPCRVERLLEDSRAGDAGERFRVRARAYFPAETDLRAGGADRVVVRTLEWRVSAVRLEGGERDRLLVAELYTDKE